MASIDLRIDATDRVAWIVLNNPARANAISASMWTSLAETVTSLRDRGDVQTLCIVGDGAHFSSGAEISELHRVLFSGENLIPAATDALEAFPKPTIAIIRGNCIGGGWELASACDLRIAATSANIAITPARLGVVYPATGVRRLVEIVGRPRARQLLYTGRHLPAPEAAAYGLLSDVVDDDELDAVVARLLATLRSRSQLSIMAAKDLIASADDPRTAAERHATWNELSATSGEVAEGQQAFFEQRAPRFPWSPS
ncbi:enoyl-CoA hydratase/isomerase family protein [Microbacterium aquimaris]|uniref:Enoyl-CoA hydratase/isomerase family protein n=1 Tax=Microbacterium aquimaris TaxID=459816 RepID=A0ABU5N7J1_9MICO|nr:enoyl-CoA hydratase/isomerase family protein [Microbacterium aquimaris]MDZ8162038.1 enoyl-CoA hydratase/isomerase family protein [Microbacterium aquimaris]